MSLYGPAHGPRCYCWRCDYARENTLSYDWAFGDPHPKDLTEDTDFKPAPGFKETP